MLQFERLLMSLQIKQFLNDDHRNDFVIVLTLARLELEVKKQKKVNLILLKEQKFDISIYDRHRRQEQHQRL